MSGEDRLAEEIAALAQQLDDDKLLRILGLIDRLPERGKLDRLVAPHRKRLARLRPARPLTLRRLLTVPFEAALVSPERWRPGDYRIPRSHLEAVQNTALEGISGEERRDLEAALKGHDFSEGEHVLELGRRLWPRGAEVLAEAAESCRVDAGLRASMRLAGHLLFLGDRLPPFLWRLPPKPVRGLDPELEQELEALYLAAATRGREALMTLLDLLVERCDSPMLLVAPLLAVELPLPRRERATCAAVIVDRSLEELHRRTRALAGGTRPGIDEIAELALSVAAQLASLSQAPADLPFDRHLPRRLRRASAELVEKAVTEGLEELFAEACATRDGDHFAVLEAQARNIARIRTLAPQLGVASKVNYALRRAEQRACGCFEAAAREMAAGDPGILMDRLRIFELLFGSPKAVALWRKWGARLMAA